jgi:hypothetical protein
LGIVAEQIGVRLPNPGFAGKHFIDGDDHCKINFLIRDTAGNQSIGSGCSASFAFSKGGLSPFSTEWLVAAQDSWVDLTKRPRGGLEFESRGKTMP